MASGLKIQSAKYGVGTTNTLDVTGAVTAQMRDGKLNFVVAPSALNVDDPAVGQVKTLTVTYSINGGASNTTSAVDGEPISIDGPPARVASGLQIVKAQYGYDKNYQDVTSAVRTYLNEGSIDIKVSPQTMGVPDPNPQKVKYLKVDIKINDEKSSRTIQDGKKFTLSAPAIKTDTTSSASQSFMSLVGTIFYDIFLFCYWFYLFSITIEAADYGERLTGSAGGYYVLGFVAFVSQGIFPILILPIWLFIWYAIFGKTS
jgi:hypothetical protein